MLAQEPRVQIAPNVRELTESQDVQEDLPEIDTGGTHHPTGVEKEGELHPQLETISSKVELSDQNSHL